VLETAEGLSYAEIARACDDAARRAILSDSTEIQTQYLTTALCDRRGISEL